MYGAIIGAGISVLGSVAGNILSKKARKKVERTIEAERNANQMWLNRVTSEDATQRADAVRALEMLRADIADQNADARSRAVVLGGTDASVDAVRAANNRAISDTLSGIAASGAARKDGVEGQYMQNRLSLADRLASVYDDVATQSATAGNEAGKTGGVIATSLWGGKEK